MKWQGGMRAAAYGHRTMCKRRTCNKDRGRDRAGATPASALVRVGISFSGRAGAGALGVSILLVLMSVFVAPAQGAGGTVVELHEQGFFGGGDPVWVVPDPTQGSQGAPAGCTNLPPGFTFLSSRFFWNATAGVARCHFIWFFYEPQCTGGARGVEVIDKPTDTNAWVTQDPDLTRVTYANIMSGKSVGCSFDPDPCVTFPCSDANAICNSSAGWSWKDELGKAWEGQTRNCSTCMDGYVFNGEKCSTLDEVCKKLNCKAPSTCVQDPVKGPACQCPTGYTQNNSTGECTKQVDRLWLYSLNTVRSKATGSSSRQAGSVSKAAAQQIQPLVWDAKLAGLAQNWTEHINSTQCGSSSIMLSKMPGSDCSESDVWVSWSDDEASAVQLWAPVPSDDTNPRTVRITDTGSQFVGCGKASCGVGAFFTCFFWPKTV